MNILLKIVCNNILNIICFTIDIIKHVEVKKINFEEE